MELIDTHTHLHWDAFEADREAVLQRAREAGVVQIITLGTDVASSRTSVEIAGQHPPVFAAVGIHPTEAHLARPGDVERIRKLAATHEKVVAIGEIGLDFYRDTSHYQAQYDIFREMLYLARRLDLPVVIHNRKAHREMEWFFQEEGFFHLKGVMHCFSGDRTDARFYLDMGLHISFTAEITRKHFRRRDVVEYVPLDRLLIETDSPFIPPAQFPKQRNEPAFVVHVARALAEIRKLPVEDIARMTTENARRLFGLPPF